MAKITNRQRAEQTKATTKQYFIYSEASWLSNPAKRYNFELSEVMCVHCDYMPRIDSLYPTRAFKKHIKQKHPSVWHREYAPAYVIQEEVHDLAELIRAR